MTRKKLSYCGAFLVFLTACQQQSQEINTQSPPKIKTDIQLVELTDQEYPDNPDIEIRHSNYNSFNYENVEIIRQKNKLFTLKFIPNEAKSGEIILNNINLLEWLPIIPSFIKDDEYLKHICVINQEWNRHQVKFDQTEFTVQGQENNFEYTRIDLARNCLNSYLWEFFINANSPEGKSKNIYHGWFDFPEEKYAELFEEKNGIPFSEYKNSLVNWLDPESKAIDLTALRTENNLKVTPFDEKVDEMYPAKGERKKKMKNIVAPKDFKSMRDFLTDSTLFATFTPPGFYNTKDPRTTELGRFRALNEVKLLETTSKNNSASKTFELQLNFNDDIKNRSTTWIIGGLNKQDFPVLSVEEANAGWMMPMGISTHSFYESYQQQQNNLVEDNPYFSVLLDEKGKWLDSHKVGIDGPLIHIDKNDPSKLHLWTLSFERHAFTGHYVIQL